MRVGTGVRAVTDVVGTANRRPKEVVALRARSDLALANPSQTGVVLFAALVFVMVAQGGYFGRGQPIVAILMTGALALALACRRIRLGDFAHPVVVTSGLVAAWSLGRAAGLGTIGLGLGTAALVGLTSATFLLTRAESEAAKRVLLNGVLVVGGVVAMSGWVGVVFRWEPLAIPAAGLWRAATVITYANAAAIVLVMLALVGLGQLAAGRNAGRSVLLMLLLLGAAATLSRGGALAFLVGLSVLAFWLGPTRLLAVLVAPAAGRTGQSLAVRRRRVWWLLHGDR